MSGRSLQFTLKERVLSLKAWFYCCEHTNWWTTVAYESKVSINIELPFLQRCLYDGGREGGEGETPRSTHTLRHALPPRKANRLALVYSSKQTFSPSCTPHTQPLLRASSNARCEIVTFFPRILTYKSIRRIRIYSSHNAIFSQQCCLRLVDKYTKKSLYFLK